MLKASSKVTQSAKIQRPVLLKNLFKSSFMFAIMVIIVSYRVLAKIARLTVKGPLKSTV